MLHTSIFFAYFAITPFPGLASALLLLCIGYDRYNVIVLGLSGRRLTPTMSAAMVAVSFLYPVATDILPLMDIWGKFHLGN